MDALEGLPLIHSGKVRRLYDMPDNRMLMVASDAVSAFDHVLDSVIPGKGVVLTQMSLWWFDQLDYPNHVVSTDVPVAGRSIIVEKLDMVPIEAVARGYLTGSGLAEYRETGAVCGVPLPAGLNDGDRLPEPIFTPAFKAPMGSHDENISFERMCELVGDDLAAQVRNATLDIYATAAEITEGRGIVLADTKLEFGTRADGTLVLADEVLTPDSSRFWDAEDWKAGTLTSFDKQYLRDWLNENWDRSQRPPALPEAVVEATRLRYLEAYRRLTGNDIDARLLDTVAPR